MGRMMMGAGLALLVAGLGAVQEAEAQQALGQEVAATASATILDTDGNEIGTAELTQTPNYGVLIRLDVEGLEPGGHGFHIHETGQCTPPDFGTTGGHYAPRGRSHGVLHPHGRHAGDLMNLHIPDSGDVRTERLAEHVSLIPGTSGFLLDDDGSALVVHANPDDYESQPAGAGGPKLACGVIR